MDGLRPLRRSGDKLVIQVKDSSTELEEFFRPQLDAGKAELTSKQIEDYAKKLFKDFSSLEDTVFLTEEGLTDAIKQEAGDSKTSQLLIATKLKDLVSQDLRLRRDNASRILREQILAYSQETKKMQEFFKTVETVVSKLGLQQN